MDFYLSINGRGEADEEKESAPRKPGNGETMCLATFSPVWFTDVYQMPSTRLDT